MPEVFDELWRACQDKSLDFVQVVYLRYCQDALSNRDLDLAYWYARHFMGW